jgi:serine/threonine protein kinase
MLLQAGQEILGSDGGCFRVLQWEGEGSYARVYRARIGGGDGRPDDSAAIKLAKSEVEGAADRLQREQAVHAEVCHRAIPYRLDAGEIEGVPWLALRWVAGETLRRRLEQARGLALVQAVPILLRIAEGVAALHAAGWSHGDLRPDNVFLETETQLAFLLDLSEAEPLTNGYGPPPAVKAARRRGWLRRGRASPAAAAADGGGPAPDHRVARDLRQLGELLAWTLTGVDPASEPDRLSRASGYHPVAVQVWQEARDGRLISAAAFHEPLASLARQLGLARG